MKHLAESQLLTLIQPSDNQRAVAFGQLRKISTDTEYSDFVRAVRAGIMHSATVCVDRVPSYVVFYQRNAFGALYVSGVGALVQEDNFMALLLAINKLADMLKTSKIVFHTDRLGLIEKTKAAGYRVTKVMLEKP